MIRTLDRPPGGLAQYARAGAGAIPGAQRLGFLPGGGGAIPDLRLRLPGVRTQPEHLARYQRLCGLPARERLPATYPHILAFPLHMAILTNRHFPHPPVGLIHIENQIVAHRAIPIGEELELHAHAACAEPHPRGVSFELITVALIAGERVWESTSTMLHRSEHKQQPSAGAAHERDTWPTEVLARTVEQPEHWRLPRDLGRRYAALSGDRNPIHTHTLAARALGFPGVIAHGMWTFARTLAALGGELPDGHAIDGAFRKPIVLPARVQLSSRSAEGETEFAVNDAERHTPHLRGRIWALAQEAGHERTRKQEA